MELYALMGLCGGGAYPHFGIWIFHRQNVARRSRTGWLPISLLIIYTVSSCVKCWSELAHKLPLQSPSPPWLGSVPCSAAWSIYRSGDLSSREEKGKMGEKVHCASKGPHNFWGTFSRQIQGLNGAMYHLWTVGIASISLILLKLFMMIQKSRIS